MPLPQPQLISLNPGPFPPPLSCVTLPKPQPLSLNPGPCPPPPQLRDPSLLRFLVDMRGEDVSNKQLRDDLMTMLIAGHETTAAVLTWTFFSLAQVGCVWEGSSVCVGGGGAGVWRSRGPASEMTRGG